MLLWEMLGLAGATGEKRQAQSTRASIRLPYETRCAMMTKAGRRCRGRIGKGSEFCPLHDPTSVDLRREKAAITRKRPRNPLAKLPDGYLRRLTSTAAVGKAMDRLYREVRLGVVTPQMGRVLFDILARLIDSGLIDLTGRKPKTPLRTTAARVRPKLQEWLTRAEKAAWQKAIAEAPAKLGSPRAVELVECESGASALTRREAPARNDSASTTMKRSLTSAP